MSVNIQCSKSRCIRAVVSHSFKPCNWMQCFLNSEYHSLIWSALRSETFLPQPQSGVPHRMMNIEPILRYLCCGFGALITASGHFLCERHQKFAVGLFGLAEAFDQVSKVHRLLS
jgi:hypothetical protein